MKKIYLFMKIFFKSLATIPKLSFFTIILTIAIFTLATPTKAATISSISPTVIVPGVSEITISGSGFGAYDSLGDQVCFNELDGVYSKSSFCSYVTSWTDTVIVLPAPSDVNGLMIAGKIHVNTNYTSFDGPYYSLQPVITSTDVSTSWAGSTVKITGKYLMYNLGGSSPSYTRVVFNGESAKIDTTTWTNNDFTVTVPKNASTGPLTIKKYNDDISIMTIGPNITILTGSSNDEHSVLQQYIKQVNVNYAWNFVINTRRPIVAIIDDGIYINHPDLRDNIYVNKKEIIGNEKDDDSNGFIDDIYGWDFISNEGEMTTRGQHGTMVAGIIGAVKNNSIGISGINPNVRLMPLIACDDRIGCPTKYVTKAIYYAVNNGATIINLSLGSKATTGYKTSYDAAIKYAYDMGVVIVAAAGNGDIESNSGQDLKLIPQSPVCNDVGNNAVIGVGAVDDNNLWTNWSNFGLCVDTYAPGVGIVSTAIPKYSTIGGFYDIEDGTSFAAPIITGIVALIRQKYPNMPNKEITNRIIKASSFSRNIIDALDALREKFKAPIIKSIEPLVIKTPRLYGFKNIIINGKDFDKKTTIKIGSVKPTIRFVNTTQIGATIPMNKMDYGKRLITITDSKKRSSIFRWLEIKK